MLFQETSNEKAERNSLPWEKAKRWLALDTETYSNISDRHLLETISFLSFFMFKHVYNMNENLKFNHISDKYFKISFYTPNIVVFHSQLFVLTKFYLVT